MRLKDIGEFGFIRKISDGCLIRPKNVVKAIGDDAAVFTVDTGEAVLVTTDLLVENVHFLREAGSGFHLGHKALAVNLSDIAAMGGTAREAFVSIAIPADTDISYLEDFYRGMKALAAAFEVNILGGDTTGSKSGLIVNVCVVGVATEGEVLYRHTAKPGDAIFATGLLGESRAGLHLILNRIEAESGELRALKDAHLLPQPHLREGRFLAGSPGVHAGIDVSDGLSSDLGHILEESAVGARLFSHQIPVSPALAYFCIKFGFDPVDWVLAGGEDYVLLVTVSPDRADETASRFQAAFDRPLYRLGEITDSGKLELVDGDGGVQEIRPTGWDHFRAETGNLNAEF